MLTYLRAYLGRYIKNEKGQGAVEYALIIALVSIVLVGALAAMSGGLDELVKDIAAKLNITP